LVRSKMNPNTSSTGRSTITLDSIVVLSDPPGEARRGHTLSHWHDATT
jgi:hypothetical protein